jgi:hypothetical protein
MLFSLFFSNEMQVQRKGELTMELPLTLWLEWLLQNLLPPLLCSQNPLLGCKCVEPAHNRSS